MKITKVIVGNLLGQWLNFKLFGITYLVGKISRSNVFFFQGPGRLSEVSPLRIGLCKRDTPSLHGFSYPVEPWLPGKFGDSIFFPGDH